MSFLAGILASILEWIISKFVSFGLGKIKEAEDNKAIDDKAKADAEALAKAKTEQEKKDALKNSIGHTFHD